MTIRHKVIHNLFIIFIFLMMLLELISFIHPTFYLDEQYSMSLIHHSYSNLVNINMLDVHPPTYYLLLKLFISICTFYTSNIIIKIFVARFFSFIIFLILFHELCKLLIYCNVHVNKLVLFSLYLLLPAISMGSINIRMYSFYSLFVVLTYIQLIKYDNTSKTSHIILATLFAVITTYIDYFAAVCVGAFILIFFMKDLIKHNQKYINFLLSELFLLLFSLPIIYMMYKQIKFRAKFSVAPKITLSAFWPTLYSSFSQVNISNNLMLITSIIFIFLTAWSLIFIKNKLFNSILVIPILNFIITMIISLIACHHFNVMEVKFFYPQFVIYSFMLMNVLINMFYHSYNMKIIKIFTSLFAGLITIILLFISLNITYRNYEQYMKPSINLISNLKYSKSSKNINIDYNNVPNNVVLPQGKALYITQLSTLLQYSNKKLTVTHCKPLDISSNVVNGKNKLLKKDFNNLNFRTV